jgi:PAS domain S-box-containing protein
MTQGLTAHNLRTYLSAGQVIDSIGDPVSVVNATGQLIYFNDAWLEIMEDGDREANLARGSAFPSGGVVAHRPDGTPVASEDTAASRALRGEAVRESEIILTYPSGRRVWLNTTAYPIEDVDGSVIGAVAVSRDISQMRRLERSHERERLRLQTIFDHAPVGMVLISAADLRIIEHNEMGLQFVSRELREQSTYAGMTIREIVDSATASALESLVSQAVKTGEVVTVPEFRAVVRPETQPRYFRGSLLPISTKEEDVQQILACSIEVTDVVRSRQEMQRLTEAAQARAHELETVIKSMADAVIITDADSRAILANPAYHRLLGSPAPGEDSAERIQKYNLRHWNGTPVHKDEMVAVQVLHGVPHATMDYIVMTDDGKDVYLRTTATPLRDTRGEISGSVVVLRDETAMRELDKQKDEFLSLVSHELRTPVTIIRGFAQVVQRSLETGDIAGTHRRVDIIKRQVDQLTSLINELLDLTRVQSGRFECNLVPLDYRMLVDSVLEEMKTLHPEREFSLAIPEEVSVKGDAVRLRQVLANLIDNALKHGPTGGNVTVTVEVHDAVTTYVCDAGEPLPVGERERVFERFYRVAPRPIQHGGSLGLGLFISRAIVEAHGGRIWVADDDHSSFAFSVQRAEIAGARADEPATSGRERDSGPHRSNG